jgi:hypothetical protein
VVASSVSARAGLPTSKSRSPGGQVRVTRYTFNTPYFAGSIWYDKANLWVRGEFERDGSKVQYQLDA